MKRLIKYLISFLESRGETSSRKLAGLFLIFSGGFSKLSLIAYGAKLKLITAFTLYDKIDETANTMIWSGVALLGVTTVDKLKGIFKK